MDMAKIWIPLLVLAALVGGSFAYRHLDMVDKANAAYILSRDSLKVLEDNLAARKAQWETAVTQLNDAKAKFAEAQAVEAKAKAVADEAASKQRKTESEIRYMAGSLAAQVEKVRSADIGTVLPAVTLNDGKRLSNAQIKKIEPAGISFIHSDGTGLTPVDKLPVELLEKYDLNANGLVEQVKQLEAEMNDAISSKNKKKAVVATTAPAPTSTVPSTKAADDAKKAAATEKLKSVQFKIAEMTTKINALSRTADQWNSAVQSAASAVSDAKYRGVPSVRYAQAEANARAQYGLCMQQMSALEAEYRKLKVEEKHLKAEAGVY